MQAAISEAVGDAVQRLRAEVTSVSDHGPSQVIAGPVLLGTYVGGLASAVALAWTIVSFGPQVGAIGFRSVRRSR